jgi:hypothetical protein
MTDIFSSNTAHIRAEANHLWRQRCHRTTLLHVTSMGRSEVVFREKLDPICTVITLNFREASYYFIEANC